MYKLATVITGTFRKFHYGHLNLIRRAAKLNLPITVLLNSDQGIKALGKRQGDSFLERKEYILDTGLVNNVCWFHVDPKNWLRLIRPYYLIAGSDHTREEILKKGGLYVKHIAILNRTPGISSSILLTED